MFHPSLPFVFRVSFGEDIPSPVKVDDIKRAKSAPLLSLEYTSQVEGNKGKPSIRHISKF